MTPESPLAQRSKAIIDAKIAEMEAYLTRRSRTRIEYIFPDSGPCRRDLYPKHLEFIAAGAQFRERAFIAANRCLTPWTAIETDHASRQFSEILGAPYFDVRSWDGNSRCTRQASGVFLKGIEPAFQIRLDNGEVFQCSRKHLVLTAAGSWSSLGQLIQSAGGLHCRRVEEDCQASYGTAYHPDDQQPHPQSGTEPRQPPLLPGVLEWLRCQHLLADAAERIGQYSRASGVVDHHSSLDVPIHVEDLCARYSDPSGLIADLWPSGLRSDVRRFLFESGRAQLAGSFQPRLPSSGRPLGSEYRDGSRRREKWDTKLQEERLFDHLEVRLTSGREFLESLSVAEIFFPSNVFLSGGNSIVSVVPLGLQPIIDFQVEGTHCYELGGAIHHNCGKTMLAAYEVACHLTGKYPAWWNGRRFNAPVRAWACGTTNVTTRDIVQANLLGPVGEEGTGMIPADAVLSTVNRAGIPGAIDTAMIQHVSGGKSALSFKSYESGRKSFEGTGREIVWMDEEPDISIYVECLIRTATTRGIILATFTPLEGWSDVVKSFIEPEEGVKRFWIQAGWEDCPHLDEDTKRELLASIQPYQREARTKGTPSLGSGAIYPVMESDIVVSPFRIPDHWPRAYGMDVGWNRTAVVWLAKDPDDGVIYVYSEHYVGSEKPPMHAEAIKARGLWIPGVIDPASNGRSQADGEQLLATYRKLGLNIHPADNSVETGIYEVWTLFSAGLLKVFSSCSNGLSEMRKYRRDEKGRVVKKDDHWCDGLRYGIKSGRDRMIPCPAPKRVTTPSVPSGDRGWMA